MPFGPGVSEQSPEVWLNPYPKGNYYCGPNLLTDSQSRDILKNAGRGLVVLVVDLVVVYGSGERNRAHDVGERVEQW